MTVTDLARCRLASGTWIAWPKSIGIEARPRSRVGFIMKQHKLVEGDHHFPVGERTLIGTSGVLRAEA